MQYNKYRNTQNDPSGNSISESKQTINVNNPDSIKLIYPSGILKLNYEIKNRKKEFINLCLQYDPTFSSYIDQDDFKEILDKFTCYLKLDEKKTISNIFTMNDSYVNYIDVSTLNIFEDIRFNDPFLIHLNEKINIPRTCLIEGITKNKKLDISPIEELNKRISEENFNISVCKKVMEFIVINSKKLEADEYFNKLFTQLDFDSDGQFTIGEMNNLLLLSGIDLPDFELRFFFESFSPSLGKIKKIKLKSYFYELYQKTISKPANTDFAKNDNIKSDILTNEEKLEENKIFKIMHENEFISQILDSIFVLGKTFIIKFFSKYFVIDQNKFLIDLTWLELGYKKLNYPDIPSDDVGRFKFFCVLKNIGFFKDKMAVYVDIEYLLDFVSKYFSLEKKFIKKDSMQTIEGISERFLKDISALFISYEHSKISDFYKQISKRDLSNNSHIGDIEESNFHNNQITEVVNEMNFRRSLINSFGFVDHYNLDHMVNNFIFKEELFRLNKKPDSLNEIHKDYSSNYHEYNVENELIVNTNNEFNQKNFNLINYYKIDDYNNKSQQIKNSIEGTIKNSNENNEKDLEESEKLEINNQISFKLRTINNKNWIGLGFNLLFMSLIKFHEQIGLLLEPSDIASVKNVYTNLERKIFPKQRLSSKKFVNLENKEKIYVYTEDVKEANISFEVHNNKFEKININNRLSVKDSIKTVQKEYNLLIKEKEKVNKISDSNFIEENNFAGYIVHNGNDGNTRNTIDKKENRFFRNKKNNNNEYNPNLSAHINNKERITYINTADSAEIVPELYKYCTEFLKIKFKMEKVDFHILRSIGVCKVFREFLKENKVNPKIDIDYLALVSILRPMISEKIYKFLEYFAFRNKDINNLINIQLFFAKIEDVLLQYSKIVHN